MSDSNLHGIADQIEREALRTQGLLDAAAYLRRVGSLEQAARDAQMAYDKERAKLETAKKETLAAQAELNDAKEALADAQTQAEATINKATAEAKRLTDEGRATAEGAVAHAKSEAQRVLAETQASAQKQQADMRAEQERHNVAKRQAEDLLAKVKSDIAAAGRELEAIRQKTSEAKAAARKLIEG